LSNRRVSTAEFAAGAKAEAEAQSEAKAKTVFMMMVFIDLLVLRRLKSNSLLFGWLEREG